MKLISTSTLHIELLPKEYAKDILVLGCGFNEDNTGLFISEKIPLESYDAKKYAGRLENFLDTTEIDTFSVQPAIESTSAIKEESKELLMAEIENLASASIDKEEKSPTFARYQALVVAYLLEKKQIAVNLEVQALEKVCSALVEDLPDAKKYAETAYIPQAPSYTEDLWKTLPSCIAYFVGGKGLLVSSCSKTYAMAEEEGLCTDIPKNIVEMLDSLGLSKYTKGYAQDISKMLSYTSTGEPIPMLFLEDI